MFEFLSNLSGGAGSLIGGVASGAMNLLGGMNANAANSKQADKANNFNQAMLQHQMNYNHDEAELARAWQEAQAGKAMDFTGQWAQRQMDFQGAQTKASMDFEAAQAQQQMQFQAGQANTAMGFAERMASTQYQRALRDMKAAGLNPMLAYQQGGNAAPVGTAMSGAAGRGAAAPGASAHGTMGSGAQASGATTTGQRAQMENVLGPAVATAFQSAQAVQAIRNLAAENARIGADTDRIRAQSNNINANTAKQKAEFITETGRPDLLRSEETRNRANAAASTSSARLMGTQADLAPEIAAAGVARDRATAGERQAQESHTRQDIEANRTYGRRGAGNIETTSQVTNSVGEAAGRALSELRRWIW